MFSVRSEIVITGVGMNSLCNFTKYYSCEISLNVNFNAIMYLWDPPVVYSIISLTCTQLAIQIIPTPHYIDALWLGPAPYQGQGMVIIPDPQGTGHLVLTLGTPVARKNKTNFIWEQGGFFSTSTS